MNVFSIAIIMLIATLGPTLVIGLLGYAAVKSLGRNPSAAPRIFISIILAFIFVEAIAIIALLVVLNLFR